MKAMNQKERNKLADKLEEQLKELSLRIYELLGEGRRLIPKHPYVLVRVLPKEHRTEGGIWLADTDQNKVVYEAIVLEIWKPYDEIRDRHIKADNHDRLESVVVHHESKIHVGDRIAFPHFEGLSTKGYLDDRYYRLVREGGDQNAGPFCSVLGTIDYKGDVEAAKQIRELTAKLYSVTTSGVSLSRGETPRRVD